MRRPSRPLVSQRPRRRLAPLLSAALALLTGASAHHDTETQIRLYTERIEAGERTAEIYYQRATEYRVLRRPQLAEADLRRALDRDPAYAPARAELARILNARGEPEAALDAAAQNVAAATTPRRQAAALMLLARLLADNAEPAAALHACDSALDVRPEGEVEWFLLRAELLGELGRGSERPETLAAGHRATGSIVLRNARLDSLLDEGRAAEALPTIEAELASARLKSTWLLRRARATFTTDPEAARADLEACLAELEGRIHPARPDLTLVADRGLAHALLGHRDRARADLARANRGGADRWVTAALERALEYGDLD